MKIHAIGSSTLSIQWKALSSPEAVKQYRVTLSYTEEDMNHLFYVNKSTFIKQTKVLWNQNMAPNTTYTVCVAAEYDDVVVAVPFLEACNNWTSPQNLESGRSHSAGVTAAIVLLVILVVTLLLIILILIVARQRFMKSRASQLKEE